MRVGPTLASRLTTVTGSRGPVAGSLRARGGEGRAGPGRSDGAGAGMAVGGAAGRALAPAAAARVALRDLRLPRPRAEPGKGALGRQGRPGAAGLEARKARDRKRVVRGGCHLLRG